LVLLFGFGYNSTIFLGLCHPPLWALSIIWLEQNRRELKRIEEGAVIFIYYAILHLFKFWTGVLINFEHFFNLAALSIEGFLGVFQISMSPRTRCRLLIGFI
jgi:hypothetical protein